VSIPDSFERELEIEVEVMQEQTTVVEVAAQPAPIVEVIGVGLAGPEGPQGPPGASVETRLTATHTTVSLSDSASEQSSIQLAKAYRLLSLSMDVPARVRLYDRAAKQVADVSRAAGVVPVGDSGLVLDFVGSLTELTANLSPQVFGDNMETTPSSNIPITVTNLSGVTQSVTIQFVYAALG